MVMTPYPSQYKWHHQNATGNSVRQTGRGGNLLEATELDPLGNAYVWNHPSFPIPEPEPEPTTTERDGPNEPGSLYGTASNPVSGCMVDGVTTPCSIANWFLESGNGFSTPLEFGIGGVLGGINTYTGQATIYRFHAFADGYGGLLAHRERYVGGGEIRGGGVERVYGGRSQAIAEIASIGEIASIDGGFSFSLELNPQNAGQRVRLSGVFGNLFRSERNILLSILGNPESDCAKFLKETFGFDASRVAKAVRAIRAFDADASTITMGAAGLAPYHLAPSGKWNEDASIPVNRYFDAMRIYGRPITAKQAGYSMKTMRDIYFSGMGGMITAPLILHETLHMFTGMKDEELANRLGVTLNGSDTTPITEALAKGGCGSS
jgi:hypothetical protein